MGTKLYYRAIRVVKHFFVLSLWRFYYPESQKDKKVVAFDGMFRYTRVVTQGANRTELAMFKDSTMAKWYDIVEVVAWVVYAATFVWFLLTDANAAVNANLLAAAWAFPMQMYRAYWDL